MTSDVRLTKTRLHAGHWEGVLTHAAGPAPALSVSHQGKALETPEILALAGAEGQSQVRVRIPAELLGEGVHSFVIADGQGRKLADFSIIAGEVLADDLRAEVALLRAELDMLKQAFRRHCVETA